jgi:phenylacetate-CoA ligase
VRITDALRICASTVRLQRTQWRSATQIRAYQRARLARILAFSAEHVPHYRHLEIGAKPERPEDWLARFPILSKSDLQIADGSLIPDHASRSRLHQSRTSGSTGEPTVSYFDHSTWLFCKYALKLRRMLNCGLGFGSRVLIVSEADEHRLRAERQAVLPGQGKFFLQAYDAIYAFPSYLSELLDYCESHGYGLPPVKVVFTSSELLTPLLRQRLEASFGARVCDIYGCTEFKEVAWQCEAGRYHVNHESVWIESVSEAHADEPGALVLTTLVNRGLPLIRYRVGDLGRLTWEGCVCGRQGPVLSELAGREVELLELPDGRRLSPYLLTTSVEDVNGLRQYQFVQTANDCLELRFTAFGGCCPDQSKLRRRLREILGTQMRVQISQVSKVPRTPGGKRRVFVRELTDRVDN